MLETYLSRFGDLSALSIEAVYREMDRVWDELGLDNARPLAVQGDRPARFYAHPVWVLNGLFSEADPLSRAHREAIAEYAVAHGAERVADFGGGSGVLATLICQRSSRARVDIVEPYPHPLFTRRHQAVGGLRYRPDLGRDYDLVIAQDVLEHVDEPLPLACELIGALREGGTAIFANCFHPLIKCHLPATFYLRHQFHWLARAAGLRALGPVPGAEHAQAYRKDGPFDARRMQRWGRMGRRAGWLTNALVPLWCRWRQSLFNH